MEMKRHCTVGEPRFKVWVLSTGIVKLDECVVEFDSPNDEWITNRGSTHRRHKPPRGSTIWGVFVCASCCVSSSAYSVPSNRGGYMPITPTGLKKLGKIKNLTTG